MILKKSFYNRNTVKVAKELLGKYLIHKTKDGTTIGKIVETEAYLSNDPGSHSSIGKTKRNEKMFGKPGKAYIYLIYGMYNCFNVVTKPKGIGEAVLIRALEPVSGINLMKKRRNTNNIKNLCTGPAKLAIAMALNSDLNGADLTKPPLKIMQKENSPLKITKTTRIGITKGSELALRFYIKDNQFISRK